MAKIIDGNALAETVKIEVKETIERIGIRPRLDVILVGDNPASEIYVHKKQQACERVGIDSVLHRPKSECDIIDKIFELNKNDFCHGILIQLPLPKGYLTHAIFDAVCPLKDVDVFNTENIGLLVQNRPRFLPPTPHAVQKLINSVTSLAGKHVVVINRSDIVGKPLSSMLIQDNGEYANATVTVCHNQTPPEQLKTLCLTADIIVVAVGIPNFLTEDMVAEKQIIIDVGITRIGKKIVGDVDPLVVDKVSYITLVPGGVGPVTVSMLLFNTVRACVLLQNGVSGC